MRRLFPPFWVLISVVLMTALDRYAPLQSIIPPPFERGGVAFMVVGLLLVLWSARLFSQAKTTIKPFSVSSSLVTSGPFRLSRNPIYVGMVIVLLGVAIRLGSLPPFAVIPFFVLLINRAFIVHEERMLLDTFGKEYEAYCRGVRRWI